MISMLKIYFGENVNKNKRVIQTCDISTILSCFGKARLFFSIFMIHLLSTLSIVLLPAYSHDTVLYLTKKTIRTI